MAVESSRPGYIPVSVEEETNRVAPVIEAVKERFDIPVSLDTCKSGVARAGIAAGADLINDIWGFKYDPVLAGVAAETNSACCLMHNRREAGVADERIILDPGVGFGKTYENNLEIIDRMEMLHCLGYPILLGTSRKSVIGNALDLPKEERVEGTIVTTVYAVLKGAMFVRVHDVKENVRAVRMAEAIRDGWRQNERE